jgi:hypothetical protein
MAGGIVGTVIALHIRRVCELMSRLLVRCDRVVHDASARSEGGHGLCCDCWRLAKGR